MARFHLPILALFHKLILQEENLRFHQTNCLRLNYCQSFFTTSEYGIFLSPLSKNTSSLPQSSMYLRTITEAYFGSSSMQKNFCSSADKLSALIRNHRRYQARCCLPLRSFLSDSKEVVSASWLDGRHFSLAYCTAKL